MSTASYSSAEFYFSLSKTIVNTFGILTNGICVVVFFNSKMKDISFKYMLTQSINDCIYFSILAFNFLNVCSIDEVRTSLGIHLYFIISNLVSSILAIFYIFIEIWLSLNRYLMLKNKKSLDKLFSFKKTLFFLAILSFIYYFPQAFLYEIKSNTNSTSTNKTIYFHEHSTFSKTNFGKILFIFLEVLRIFLNSLLVPFINILFMIEYRKRSKKKAEIRAKYNLASIKN